MNNLKKFLLVSASSLALMACDRTTMVDTSDNLEANEELANEADNENNVDNNSL